jgi:hypothetical protein
VVPIIAQIFLGNCRVQDSEIRQSLSFSHGVYEAVKEDVLVKDRTPNTTPFLIKV